MTTWHYIRILLYPIRGTHLYIPKWIQETFKYPSTIGTTNFSSYSSPFSIKIVEKHKLTINILIIRNSDNNLPLIFTTPSPKLMDSKNVPLLFNYSLTS